MSESLPDGKFARIKGTLKPVFVTFPESLGSAQLFKYITDEVLEHGIHPTPHSGIVYANTPDDSQEQLTELDHSEGRLGQTLVALNGNSESLVLTDMYGNETTVLQEELAQPIKQLRVWASRNDSAMNGAAVEIDGKLKFAKYIGSPEWYRYLEISFGLDVGDGDHLRIGYSMSRAQHAQDQPEKLSKNYSLLSHFETGYEGSGGDLVEISEEQELRFLTIVASVAGIALRNTQFETMLVDKGIPVLDPVGDLRGQAVERAKAQSEQRRANLLRQLFVAFFSAHGGYGARRLLEGNIDRSVQ